MKRIRLMLVGVLLLWGGNSVLLADIPAIGGTWGRYVYSSNPRGYIKGWGGWQGSCPIWINRGGYELDISDTPKWMLVRYTVSENYTINDREAVISFNYYDSFKDGITEIGDYAFCSYGMSGVKLPSTLEKIGDYAFSGCSFANSGNVVLPDTVTSIGKGTFERTNISKIDFPASVSCVNF